MKPRGMIAALIFFIAVVTTAQAQQVTGTLGSPDATTTISGKQLPAPDPKFGGVIKDDALQVESVVGAAHRAPQRGAQHPAHHHG